MVGIFNILDWIGIYNPSLPPSSLDQYEAEKQKVNKTMENETNVSYDYVQKALEYFKYFLAIRGYTNITLEVQPECNFGIKTIRVINNLHKNLYFSFDVSPAVLSLTADAFRVIYYEPVMNMMQLRIAQEEQWTEEELQHMRDKSNYDKMQKKINDAIKALEECGYEVKKKATCNVRFNICGVFIDKSTLETELDLNGYKMVEK